MVLHYRMGNYITKIHINELLHLKDIDIEVCDEKKMKHLIITGPNGTGKTVFLKGLMKYLLNLEGKNSNSEKLQRLQRLLPTDQIYPNGDFDFELLRDDVYAALLEDNNNTLANLLFGETFAYTLSRFEFAHQLQIKTAQKIGKTFLSQVDNRQFIIAYYDDSRQSQFVNIDSPEKPNLSYRLTENKTDQFIKYLVDLRFQQAMARNEGQQNEADKYSLWFETFEKILRQLFNNDSLTLTFDYKKYQFKINEEGKEPYDFTQLSAGYAAALDIIADLMLKMQGGDDPVRSFDMEGVVLIDEIDTHLHLGLQKQILPLLTSIFPKIQFIVTTHSPFILNSIENATVFDLKSRETVTDLTEYSYEALAEGFFGVETESGELRTRLQRMEELISKDKLTNLELDDLKHLAADFEQVPDAMAPMQKAQFRELEVKMSLKGLR